MQLSLGVLWLSAAGPPWPSRRPAGSAVRPPPPLAGRAGVLSLSLRRGRTAARTAHGQPMCENSPRTCMCRRLEMCWKWARESRFRSSGAPEARETMTRPAELESRRRLGRIRRLSCGLASSVPSKSWAASWSGPGRILEIWRLGWGLGGKGMTGGSLECFFALASKGRYTACSPR